MRATVILTPQAAIVPTYNIEWVGGAAPPTSLIFTREILPKIFLGNITSWRDPLILAANPSFSAYLPEANITVCVRTDSSGQFF
jgi:phosphate transport system substrate-binding protein